MHPEVLRQVTAADEIVISKIDIASAESTAACRAQIYEANPSARIHEVANGDLDNPVEFLGAARPNRPSGPEEIAAWFGGVTAAENHAHCSISHAAAHGHDHNNKIKSLSIELDKPITWAGYACWVDLLRQIPARHLLRMKGLVNIRDAAKPAVIHAVQHLFYPPTFLDRWPTADHKSKIVLITWDLNNLVLERSLEAFNVPHGSETKLVLAHLLQGVPN
jgi:G3E family GTPase